MIIMIKNIIFDLGNVLLNFEAKKYLGSKIPLEKIEIIYKGIFQSEEWISLDRGTITEECNSEIWFFQEVWWRSSFIWRKNFKARMWDLWKNNKEI